MPAAVPLTRDKVLEICQMMVAESGITLRGRHHRKGIVLVTQNDKMLGFLRGHVFRGTNREVDLSNAFDAIRQVARADTKRYELGKGLLMDSGFRGVKSKIRVLLQS